MKSAIVKAIVVGLALTTSLAQAREKAPVQTIKIDWNDKSTLSDSIVMMCDDTVLSAVEIIVPGKPHKNFRVSVLADVTDVKPELGCSIKKVEGKSSTKYILDAPGGGCDIQIDKVRQDMREKPARAEYSISDAC